MERSIAHAIRFAKQVYSEPGWRRWAENWLNGRGRTAAMAHAAAAMAALSIDMESPERLQVLSAIAARNSAIAAAELVEPSIAPPGLSAVEIAVHAIAVARYVIHARRPELSEAPVASGGASTVESGETTIQPALRVIRPLRRPRVAR